jgi:geranylgeranyl diphosphate synthase type I
MTILGLHGPDLALIAGDALIIKGWTMAVALVKKTDSEKLAKIIEIFGNWTLDVCEAEFMEISCRKNLNTEIDCYERILRKSIADAEACAKLGAIMGNGSEEEIQALAEFGDRLGFMYRLAGEAKDMINVEANLAIRLQNESVPLPLLYAAKTSNETYNQIESILMKSKIPTTDLVKLQQHCFKSGGFAYLINKSESNLKEALKKVRLLKPSSARNNLELMVQKSYSDISDMFR